MPAGTPIDQIFNEPAIQAQFQRVSAQLDSFAAQMLKVQQANENTRAGNSFSSVSASIKEVQGELGKLKSVNDLLIKNELDLQRAIVATETARLKSAQAKLTEAKADTEVIKQLKIELDYEQKLASAKTTRSATPTTNIPFTTNVDAINAENAAATNATGVAVSQLEQEQAAAAVAANKFADAENLAADALGNVDATVAQTSAAVEYYVNLLNEAQAVEAKELGISEQVALAYLSVQAELNDTNAALKANEQAFNQGLITRENFVAVSTELTVEQQQLKASLAGVQAELTAQTATTVKDVGAYALLNQQYQAAALNAKNLAAQFGVDSIQAKEAAASAALLGKELLAIDKTVGQSQRNVGNYTSALSGIWSVLRQAAYILPGVGIAGILGFFTDGISKLVSKIFDLVPAFDAAREAHRNWVAVMEDADKSSEKEVINLKALYKSVTDINTPMSVRVAGVQTLQKEYPTFLGNLKQEAILNGEAAKQVDALADALFKRALMEAEANKAAELGSKNFDLQGKALFLLKEQQKSQAYINELQKENNLLGSDDDRQRKKNLLSIELQQSHLKDINKLLDDNRLQQRGNNVETQRYIDDIAKHEGIVQEFIKPAATKEAQSKFNDYLQSLIKARRDAQIQQLQDEAKFQQSIADLQNGGLGDNQRVIAEQKASSARLQIIKINEDAEIQLNQLALNQILADKKVSDGDKLEAEKAYQAQNQNIVSKANAAIIQEQVNTNIAVAKIRKEENDKLDADLQANYDKMAKPAAPVINTELINSLVEAEQKAFEYGQTIRATNYATQKQQVQQQYVDGKTTYKQYQDDLHDIELANQKLILQDQITSQEAILAIYEKYGTIGSADAQKVKKLIAELKASLSGVKIEISTGSLDDLQTKLETIVGYIQRVSDLIGQAVNANVTTQKNALQALEDQQERNYEAEVARINNSTLTLTQQQAALIKLDATRQAQKEANDRKSRAIDRQQAEFQKAATIMQIITTTALAVVSELAKHSFPGAIAAGVLGAAELAIAIATPVPKFEKGGIVQKDGIIQVSEKGAELGIKKDGTMFMTPEKESLIHASAGTKIIPHDEVDKVMYNLMLRNTANKINTPTDPMPALALQQLKAMQQLANKKQVRPIVNINLDKYYFDNVKR